MPRAIRCPKCQQRYSVADEAAGKTLRCPKCQSVIDIPRSGPIVVTPLMPDSPPAATAGPAGASAAYWPGVDAPRTAPASPPNAAVAPGSIPQGQFVQGQILQGQIVPTAVVPGQIVQGQVWQAQPAVGTPFGSAGYGAATWPGGPQPTPQSFAPAQPAAPADLLSQLEADGMSGATPGPGHIPGPGYHPGLGNPGLGNADWNSQGFGGQGFGSQGSQGGQGGAGPLGPSFASPWRKKTPWLKIVGIASGAGAGVLTMVFVISLMGRWQGAAPGGGGLPGGVAGDPSAPFDPASVPLPSFPDRGPLTPISGGVNKAVVRLPVPAGRPGFAATLYVYLPEGSHAPRSLPCVFYAPAGSTLLCGMNLGDGDSAEHLPWVRAGFAVVAYELDGDVPEIGGGFVRHEDVRRGYQQFAAAQAGLVNARNAIEYTLAKVPEVAPDRLYTAGHSSAGTAALLVAAFEPRIRGCAAFAPAADPSVRPECSQLIQSMLGGDGAAHEFLRRSSPAVNASKIRCPVYLFQSPGDAVVSYAATVQFKTMLEKQGTKVTLQSGRDPHHYDSMIHEGLPSAIRWMKNLDRPGSGDAIAAAPQPRSPTPTGVMPPPGQSTMPPGMSSAPGTTPMPGMTSAPGMTPTMPWSPPGPSPGGFPMGGPSGTPSTMPGATPSSPGMTPLPTTPGPSPVSPTNSTTPGVPKVTPAPSRTPPPRRPPSNRPAPSSKKPPREGFDVE